MKFRPITIGKLKFYPTDIMSVEFRDDCVIIEESEGFLGSDCFMIVEREKYDYPAWDSFLNQLNRTFEL